MLIIATKPFINDYYKRRSARHFITKIANLTDNNITSSIPNMKLFENLNSYNTMKNFSTLTKTQIKVIVTVVVIISFIMLIIAIFRFKNSCRSQEKDNRQTEIFRNRSSKYNEPSSRRGSIGYYTRKYSRTSSIRSNDQINNSIPTKQLSISGCNQFSKSTAVVALSLSPVDRTANVTHHHVISSCDTSNISNRHISIVPTSSIDLNTGTQKSTSSINATQVRYILVINVHDQRHQYPGTEKKNYIKLSSPTLRKLCLPCITTRHHLRHHTNKKKTRKPNQHCIVTGVTHENNRVESLRPFDVVSRTCDAKTTLPIVHNSDYSKENNANHFNVQDQHIENTYQNEKSEENSNKIEIKSTTLPLDKIESELLLSSLCTNELTKLNEDDDDECDDRTPLLTSELTSTIKDSSKNTSRKYSFNALLPLIRPSNSHPLCSSLTSTNADGTNNTNGNGVDLKPRHRASLSSALRRSSFAKQPPTFCSTIDSTNAISLPKTYQDSDSSDQISLLNNKSHYSKAHRLKKSSSITPVDTQTILPYKKQFMQKIERFRFIDDSASSTTTVTSPVESIEHVDNRPTSCSHLITSTIEQFDDYIRTRYNNIDDDDVDTLIDRLNSNILSNGSYSDLNILNNTSSSNPIQRPQAFKPVNNKPFETTTTISSDCQLRKYHQSTPINIPHSITSLPLTKQRNPIETNGYSRSMEFQTIITKRDFNRPLTMISTINEASSSSSTATLTSMRSLTSLEFDDNTKPSGVLVDDDFLPMSSPVDEHFWDMNIKSFNELNNDHKKCFPDVGSSPDMEIKHFDIQKLNTLSETSCDEDDESTTSIDQPETFSMHECKLDNLTKPIVLTKIISPIQKFSEDEILDKSSSNPSIDSTEQLNISNNTTITTTSHQSNDESLLEKFSSPSQTSIPIDFVYDPMLSLDQHSQILSDDDDTQDSSINDASEGDESADNGEIDLVQEFELSQKDTQIKPNNLWTTTDSDVYIIQNDDLLSALVSTPTIVNRSQPTSIMKITNNKMLDQIDDQQQQQQQSLKPKVRFNLDPQYEREREWNKVNKLLGNSVEWTDEFEV